MTQCETRLSPEVLVDRDTRKWDEGVVKWGWQVLRYAASCISLLDFDLMHNDIHNDIGMYLGTLGA